MDAERLTPGPARQPPAPWWHVAVVVLALGAVSLAGAYQHGLPRVPLPGFSARLSGYLTIFALEWLIVLFIWRSSHQRGQALGVLIGGRWPNAAAIAQDFAFAVGFLVVGIPLTSALAHMLPTPGGLVVTLPATSLEAAAWVVLGATAGFCEELIFRGFLMQQFELRTKSRILAIILQGIVFGLAHGYQGWMMLVIALYGCMFGVFVAWRKNLRAAMLAHGLQDVVGGLATFFFG